MSDDSPYSAPKPPKTVTEVTDKEFLDFKSLHTWVLLTSIGIGLTLVNMMLRAQSKIEGFTCFLALIAAGWIYLEYFSTPAKIDTIRIRLQFIIDDKLGRHVLNQYRMPVESLNKVVPVYKIHNEGLIEYTNGQYGVVIEVQPARVQDGDNGEERATHEKLIEKLLNGIPANVHFKTIAVSRLEPKRPVLNHLLKVTNSVEKGRATELHLTDMYNDVAADETMTISWKYYAYLNLGTKKTRTEAMIQYGAIIPGLLQNMKAAGFQPRILMKEDEIGRAYRTLYSEMIV